MQAFLKAQLALVNIIDKFDLYISGSFKRI